LVVEKRHFFDKDALIDISRWEGLHEKS
jgi:hypothetical protein